MADSDNGITKQADLPDLPALETVEARDTRIIVAMFCISLVVLCFYSFFLYIFFQPKAQSFSHRMLPQIVVLFALWLLMLWSLRKYCLYCKTNNEGIEIGLLRRRFIRWDEITEARINNRRQSAPRAKLTTAAASLTLLPRIHGNLILASIWQHLRKAGKADDFILPPRALSLWQEIPESVPREISWVMPYAKAKKIAEFCCIGIIVLMTTGISLILFIQSPGFSNLLLLIFCLLFLYFLRFVVMEEAFRRANAVSITDDYLEAQLAFEKVRLSWNKVTFAQWKDEYRPFLAMRSDTLHKEVWIPYALGSTESEQLVLAIIRKLRTTGAPKAIEIPAIISAEPALLNKPAESIFMRSALIGAFLEKLEKPIKRRIYALYTMESIFPFLGGAIVFYAMFTDAPARLSQSLHGQSPGLQYVFVPDSFILLPCIFTLGAAFWFMGSSLARWMSGKYRPTWREFHKVATASISGFEKGVMWLAAIISIAGLIELPLFFNTYVRFGQNGIGIRQFYSIHAAFYPWSQVRDFDVQKSQYICQRGHRHTEYTYNIKFADGADWKSSERDAGRSAVPQLRKAMELVSEKTGKPAISWE